MFIRRVKPFQKFSADLLWQGGEPPSETPVKMELGEGTPPETEAERRAREDALLADVAVLRAKRATLSLAYGRPWPEPARCADHHELLQQEARWLAADFGQACGAAPCTQHPLPTLWIACGLCRVARKACTPLMPILALAIISSFDYMGW